MLAVDWDICRLAPVLLSMALTPPPPLITWDEFLAYLRWQEQMHGSIGSTPAGRDGIRRSSMYTGDDATLKVEARLELRRIFDSIDSNSDHRVSCPELAWAIRFDPRARNLFMPSLLAQDLRNS